MKNRSRESTALRRFWMSWFVSEEDYRPLTYPPNAAILGWWCTGTSSDDRATLCGLVDATTEEEARAAVLRDWPGIEWRFIEPQDADYVIMSDRFPLSDWMKQRMFSRV